MIRSRYSLSLLSGILGSLLMLQSSNSHAVSIPTFPATETIISNAQTYATVALATLFAYSIMDFCLNVPQPDFNSQLKETALWPSIVEFYRKKIIGQWFQSSTIKADLNGNLYIKKQSPAAGLYGISHGYIKALIFPILFATQSVAFFHQIGFGIASWSKILNAGIFTSFNNAFKDGKNGKQLLIPEFTIKKAGDAAIAKFYSNPFVSDITPAPSDITPAPTA